MKTILITIAAFVSLNLYAQSSVWVYSDNISAVHESSEFTSMARDFKSDFLITNAFPSSRNPELLKVYEITCDCEETELYTRMHRIPGVSGIEYAPKYETLEVPNDYSTTFSTNWALNLINSQTAWDFSIGNSNVVVAITDQNYYQNHEELSGKYTFYDPTNTATRTHGTAVATIAAGNTNNGIGLSSIGYNSTLQLRRMNYNEVLQASYSGARVINMSWASSCFFNSYAQMAIDEAWNNGSFLVAAAGNGSTCGGPNSLVYPAAYNHVFAVTSIGPNDNIERTIGNPNSRHQTNSSVDICAPGFDVPLTIAPGVYLTGNGTSFASPYVTGTVALMVALKSDITNDEIETILKASATNIDAINPSYIGNIGSGRLNAGLALQMVNDLMDDGNNGHGNDPDGNDSSNPGQGNGNNGNNGNHFGWDKNDKNTLGENNNTTRSNRTVVNMSGQIIKDLEFAPVGFYFIIENDKTTKIYKN
jgi:hypothetical protein